MTITRGFRRRQIGRSKSTFLTCGSFGGRCNTFKSNFVFVTCFIFLVFTRFVPRCAAFGNCGPCDSSAIRQLQQVRFHRRNKTDNRMLVSTTTIQRRVKLGTTLRGVAVAVAASGDSIQTIPERSIAYRNSSSAGLPPCILSSNSPFYRSRVHRLQSPLAGSHRSPSFATKKDTRLFASITSIMGGATDDLPPSKGNQSVSGRGNNEQEQHSLYEQWVRRLYMTNLFHPVKMGLTNMQRLHELLGNPMDDVSKPFRLLVGDSFCFLNS